MAAPQAVIEIGSTGVRLLVSEINREKKHTVLDKSEQPVSLGRDVFTTGSISRESLLQCIQILNRFAEQLEGWGIFKNETTVLATSAIREANNRDPVVDQIKVKTGYTVKVIDGIEENRLMYIAVNDCLKNAKINLRETDSIILEISGGATEIMLLEKGRVSGAHTIRIGTVIIEQQLLGTQVNFSDARQYIEEFIRTTSKTLDKELKLKNVQTFIALGGDMKLAAQYAGKQINANFFEIKRTDFEKFVSEVQRNTVDEIVARFKLSYNDAKTMHLSLLMYSLFIKLTNVQKIIIPQTTIREGLLISKSEQANEELVNEFNMQILASARNLLHRYNGDEKHAEYVRTASLKIFDSLKDELNLDPKARILLEQSAILHDIGMFINANEHNIHSKYIILNSEIFGISRDDRSLIAQIVSFHKGSKMPQDDKEVHLLSRSDRMLILKLSAILRAADALDRGHQQKIKDFNVSISAESLTLRVNGFDNVLLEKKALAEKGDLFQNVFGYKIVLV